MSNGDFNPADEYVKLLNKGLSEAEAARHVMLRIQNLPEAVRAQYLKDVDPGALATFGLGAADMMSFGLGDQVARAVETDGLATPYGPSSPALLTQQVGEELHPTAHTAGQVAGVIGPAGVEYGLARAGRLVPSALTAAIRAIRSPLGRAAAKTGLHAAEGAAYAGAQAAGHEEGNLGDRAAAAGRAAPIGAVAGAVLPAIVPAAKVVGNRVVVRPIKAVANAVDEWVGKIAGKAARPRGLPNVGMELTPDGVGSLRPPLPAAEPIPDLGSPTYQRRGLLDPPSKAGAMPEGWQNVPTRPGGVGGHSYSGTYPRSPQITNAAEAAAAIRQLSYAELTQALNAPNTPRALRELIAQEFARRGIVGAGVPAPSLVP